MQYLRLFVALGLVLSPALAGRVSVKAANFLKAGLPDPHCKTGVLSIMDGSDKPQACCAGYCGECTDYPTCKSVNGQDSEKACCASEVLKMACGEGEPANVCLKPCTDSVPPCIMEPGEEFTTPDPDARTAGEDCDKAVDDWRKMAKQAKESGKKQGKEAMEDAK
eukprot:gnl/TRDRNA2_/TRDRNA2_178580_c0_seq1.p1 gnl/TRDRNA2_/TRDRNA2_178580_c0~~gnl/TRDRNA2_/TRDRNA2_178580_c0_seq1.p1  ORF type:complete len:165 (+),score=47.21 gnl/TRDRNA2_/TRDRNA2_178580_c0_seq1:89-583(+)